MDAGAAEPMDTDATASSAETTGAAATDAHTGPSAHAVFPAARRERGMYESFYLRAVDPRRPRGVWIRYTVHKRPRASPRGSLWLTYFDADRAAPYVEKLTTPDPAVPAGGWIAVGEAELGPDHATGVCGGARWSLGFQALAPPLAHLPRRWMYGAPLPRTKPTSPAPAARFSGTLEIPGTPAEVVELRGWPGMVGHNWGSEHAERWIWLHGVCFAEDPDAWLDVAIGRVRVAGRTTPWVANGAIALGGRRHRLGGLAARGLLVAETPRHCRLSLPGRDGLVVQAHLEAPAAAIAGWRYADPDGGGHEVANCSIAELALTVHRRGRPAQTLRTDHGAAYELGMREGGHGVALAPFDDG